MTPAELAAENQRRNDARQKLLHLAVQIAIEAPPARSKWAYYSAVRWSLIEELREALIRVGCDPVALSRGLRRSRKVKAAR